MPATKAKRKPRKYKSLKHIKKLSTLLALALRDLKKQELCKKTCVIDMYSWYIPQSAAYEGKCVTCLAGSVIHRSLILPPKCLAKKGGEIFGSEGEGFDKETSCRISALNCLRIGDVEAAHREMFDDYWGITVPKGLPDDRRITVYETNPSLWHADMKQLLADLRKAGL